jgi:hypothetical protein
MSALSYSDLRSFVADDPQPSSTEIATLVGGPVNITHSALPVPLSLASWLTGTMHKDDEPVRVVVGRGGWAPETMTPAEHQAREIAAELVGEAAQALAGFVTTGWIDTGYSNKTGAGRMGVSVYLPAVSVEALPPETTLADELSRLAASAQYEPPSDLEDYYVTVRVAAPVGASDDEVVDEMLEACNLDGSGFRRSVISVRREED